MSREIIKYRVVVNVSGRIHSVDVEATNKNEALDNALEKIRPGLSEDQDADIPAWSVVEIEQ